MTEEFHCKEEACRTAEVKVVKLQDEVSNLRFQQKESHKKHKDEIDTLKKSRDEALKQKPTSTFGSRKNSSAASSSRNPLPKKTSTSSLGKENIQTN